MTAEDILNKQKELAEKEEKIDELQTQLAKSELNFNMLKGTTDVLRTDLQGRDEVIKTQAGQIEKFKGELDDLKLEFSNEVIFPHNNISEERQKSQRLYEALKIIQSVTDGDFISSTTRRLVCEKAIKIYESTHPVETKPVSEKIDPHPFGLNDYDITKQE